MTAAYPIAAHPEPYQILGLRLQPFCLGHCEHMERHGVSFISDDPQTVELSDLLLGVFICSQTYEEFTERLKEPDWLDQIHQWGAECGVFDPAPKVALFVEYMKKGSAQPMVVFENDGRPTGAHWIQCTKIALMDAGYSESRAMNMPLGQAFYDFYKHAENNGVLRIIPPEQAALIESLENEPAQPEAAGGAV